MPGKMFRYKATSGSHNVAERSAIRAARIGPEGRSCGGSRPNVPTTSVAGDKTVAQSFFEAGPDAGRFVCELSVRIRTYRPTGHLQIHCLI